MSNNLEHTKPAFFSYVSQIQENESPSDSVYVNIFDQYEKVVVQALATSFGLDFLVHDQHGGDVDTIHNVRQIGKDEKMKYKNTANENDYNNRGDYNSNSYHSDKRYIERNREIKSQKEIGKLKDAYTGESVARNGKTDLDHVISAKEVHDDKGRVLAGLKGEDLANTKENLEATNRRTNRTKKADSMDDFLDKYGGEYTEDQKERMREKDEVARKSYNEKVNRAYYTSKKFWNDSGTAALKLGLKMGLRQALGLVFTEIWFTVKDAIIECRKNGERLFKNIAKAVKKGLKNAKKKFRDIWNKFIEGSIAGVLSSLVTTLANIFFTTAKNIIKIIRETWASFTQACNILFINPDSYPLGERFVAAAKILATGASVVAGSMVNQLLTDCPVGKVPVVGEILPTFCSVLVTGIMSCSFLYLLDHNKGIKKVVKMLNNLPDIDNFNYALKKQGELLDQYLAELMNLDLMTLKKQQHAFSAAANQLSLAKTPEEANTCLRNIYSNLGMELPWKGYRDLDSFIADRKARLVFK